MTGLKRILQDVGVNLSLGGETLSERLDSYRRRLFVTFWVLFFVLTGLVGFGAYGLWRFLDCGETASITAWAGAVGLAGGSASLVEILRRVWSEWARTSLFVALIADATQAEINIIVKHAIKTLE